MLASFPITIARCADLSEFEKAEQKPKGWADGIIVVWRKTLRSDTAANEELAFVVRRFVETRNEKLGHGAAR